MNDVRIDPSADENALLQVAVSVQKPVFVKMILADNRVQPSGALQLDAIRLLVA